MLLGELLAVISEYENVIVVSENEIIARYDGKDSIPVELNTREVVNIATSKNAIEIGLKAEWVEHFEKEQSARDRYIERSVL